MKLAFERSNIEQNFMIWLYIWAVCILVLGFDDDDDDDGCCGDFKLKFFFPINKWNVRSCRVKRLKYFQEDKGKDYLKYKLIHNIQ